MPRGNHQSPEIARLPIRRRALRRRCCPSPGPVRPRFRPESVPVLVRSAPCCKRVRGEPVEARVGRSVSWSILHTSMMWRAWSRNPLPVAAFSSHRSLLPMEPVELLVVHDDAFPLQQDVQPATAEATTDRPGSRRRAAQYPRARRHDVANSPSSRSPGSGTSARTRRQTLFPPSRAAWRRRASIAPRASSIRNVGTRRSATSARQSSNGWPNSLGIVLTEPVAGLSSGAFGDDGYTYFAVHPRAVGAVESAFSRATRAPATKSSRPTCSTESRPPGRLSCFWKPPLRDPPAPAAIVGLPARS